MHPRLLSGDAFSVKQLRTSIMVGNFSNNIIAQPKIRVIRQIRGKKNLRSQKFVKFV